MLVHALVSAWHRAAEIPDPPTDPSVERWVRSLLRRAPDEVMAEVVAANADHVQAAVRLLLTRAPEAVAADLDSEPSADAGAPELLTLVVSRGHGTDFPGGTLAEAHGRFLTGLEHHLTAPETACVAYERARHAYVNERAERLSRLASLAAATVRHALLADGDDSALRARLGELRDRDAAAAEAIAPALDEYVRIVRYVADVCAGRDTGGLTSDGLDREAVRLLRSAAASGRHDIAIRIRLARLADAAPTAADQDGGASLRLLADRLSMERRWSEAVAVLAEIRTEHPGDRKAADSLARAYTELGRWPEGRDMLLELLSEPPGPEDVQTLSTLATLGYAARDPETERWRTALLAIDPGANPFRGAPRFPGEEEPPRPLAVLREGTLEVDSALFDLPAEDHPVHMTAAIVAGMPDGQELLERLVHDDPPLAEKVIRLLGLRRVTTEQAQAQRHFVAGEEHFQHGRFDQAQRDYEAALQLDPEHLQAMVYLGDTWYRRGAYHLAQAYFEESLAMTPTAIAYRFLGDAMLRGGHGARRARRCYERALELDPKYQRAREALVQLEHASDGEDDLSAAAPAEAGTRTEPPAAPTAAPQQDEPQPSDLVRPLEANGGHGDQLRAAMIRDFGEDSFVSVADDDEQFERWLEQASPADIASATHLAVVLAFHYQMKDRDMGRWRHWIQRQVDLAKALPEDFGPAQSPMELGRNRLLADALVALAEVRRADHQLPEARLLLERSLELLEAEDRQRRAAGLVGESKHDQLFMSRDMRAHALDDLAQVCEELGDDAAAAAHRSAAMRHQETRPTTETEVDAFIGGGRAAQHEGDLDAALGTWQHAVFLAEDEDPDPLTPRILTKALNALGHGCLRLGTLRVALGCFDRARRLNERNGNAGRLAYDHLAIAQVLRERPELAGGDGIADAREHLMRALAYASSPARSPDDMTWAGGDSELHRISAPDRAWPILLELGSLLQKLGDDSAAARFLTIATSIADIVRASHVDEQRRIDVQNERIQAYAELTKVHVRLAASGDGEHARAAWLASESMRARTFLDVLGDADLAVPDSIPADLVEREQTLLARRRELRRSIGTDAAFWDEYREIAGDLDVLWQHVSDVVPEAEGYIEVRRARPAAPEDVAASLSAGDRPVVLASLVQLDSATLGVLALRADSGPLVEVRPVERARMNRFIRQNFGSAGRVRELALDMEDLFQHELAAVGELLTAVCDPGEILVACPVGALHHVPLGALRPRGELLLERNPLAMLPSASMLRALRSARHSAPELAAAVFGDPTDDLPGARAEGVAVAERYGTAAVLGSGASTAAVQEALRAAGLVHVAGHAAFDAADPLGSGLRLADGTLTARDIITLQAPALGLVVLSACETGVSESDAAEELLGLTRALLFAGADTLVVSLWKVPDLPTLDVMGGFYDAIGSGRTKVDALREAALAARERYGPERMDRWAGFQLIGDWL